MPTHEQVAEFIAAEKADGVDPQDTLHAVARILNGKQCIYCEARADRPEDNEFCVYDNSPHPWVTP